MSIGPVHAITIAGDGTPLRTFLDQTDLAHWLFTLLERGHSGEAHNVGSDEVISISEQAHQVRDILALVKPVQMLGKPDPRAIRNPYVPKISKAQQQLGLTVSIPLAQAIRLSGKAHCRKGRAQLEASTLAVKASSRTLLRL